MGKFSKRIAASLAFLLMSSVITTTFASVNESEESLIENEVTTDWEFEYNSFEEIPKELLEASYFSDEEIIYIPEEYLDPYHDDTIYTTQNVYGSPNNGGVQTYAIGAAAGVYYIPGIGQVAITVTGVLVIGGATIAAGSWLYNKVSAYFSKKSAESAADKIPKSLKSSDMKVDLKKFKDKTGSTPADRTSGTFTNGKWTITKDNSGHLGYNGNKKAWKIGNPLRQASLDRYGNVISK